MTNDELIEQIAADLMKGSLRDYSGIAAKRKRDREDAELRMKTRREQRAEIADWMLSFKTERGNSYETSLERIVENRFAFGPDVAAALAARHATLNVSIDMTTHLENCRPIYTVTLTDAGRALLEARK